MIFARTLQLQKKPVKARFGTAFRYSEGIIQPPIGEWLNEIYKIEHVAAMAERGTVFITG